MVARIKVWGDKELIHQLQQLGGGGQRRAVKTAVTFSMLPIKQQAKAKAPSETGQLQRSLISKVKTYPKKGVAFGIVGVKRGSKNPITRRNPEKYLHLVELGVKTHVIKPKKKPSLAFSIGAGRRRSKRLIVFAKKVRHPGYAGKAFMRRSLHAGKNQALARFQAKLKERIVVEAKKYAARKAKGA